MKEGIFQRKSFPWKKCLTYIERNRNNRGGYIMKKRIWIYFALFLGFVAMIKYFRKNTVYIHPQS